jgi:protein-tyrosine phosphatase
MIDIHHHLLFGLDDGSPDLETSLKMAEMAVADGITHIVCTPHSSNDFVFQPEENTIRLAELEEKVLESLGSKLTLGIGCDFHLSYENISDAIAHPHRYTINHKNYLLIEFPNMGIAPALPDHVYQLVLAGLTPIVTHPERNSTFIHHPGKIGEYIQMGCLVQITAGAILGAFGKTPQRVAYSLLDEDRVDIVASDAHNPDRRPPLLRRAYDEVATSFGQDTAQRLFVTTPRAVFYGEPVAARTDTPEDSAKAQPRKKRGFVSRLFSN